MFENDITIYGKHATKLKYLKEELSVFPRYYDVYMAGAIVGALNGKYQKKIMNQLIELVFMRTY